MNPTVLIKKFASVLKMLGLSKVIVAVFLLLVVVLTFVFLVVRASKKRQAEAAKDLKPPEPSKDPDKAPEAPEESDSSSVQAPAPAKAAIIPKDMRQSFKVAVQRLKVKVASRDYLYAMPWYLSIGQAGAGKTTMLSNTELDLPFGRPVRPYGKRPGCDWWFFDRGVVLDVDGACILSATDDTADERGWRALLGQLEKSRPQRPVDGIVLTIPCIELYGEDQDALEVRARARAKCLADRLQAAQKILGMRLPVYVVVSQCDLVPGFRSFFSELPETSRQEIFGWSSPYSLDAGFTAEFVDEAFKGVLSRLQQTQSEIFSEVRNIQDADEAFMFPEVFGQMGAPLRTYLTRIFRETGYGESFFCRGIYFSGEVEPVEVVEGALPRSANRPRFLRHLFERKIFPEFALARPASRSFLARNRATLAVRGLLAAVIIIWSWGLWWSSIRLSDETQSLIVEMEVVSKNLETVTTRDFIPQQEFGKLALEMLDGMSRITASHLSLSFIPSSWTWSSPMHENIVDALTLAFDRVIMKSLAAELQSKTDRIIYSTDGEARQPVERATIEEDAEYVDFRDFVFALGTLESNIKGFNGLLAEGFADLDVFAGVVRYVFEIDLPPSFFTRADYYIEALENVNQRPTRMDPWKDDAEARTRLHAVRFFDAAFKRNALLRQLEELVGQLEGLNGRGRIAEDGVASLEALLENIVATKAVLADPRVAWMSADRLNPSPDYADVMAVVKASEFLSDELYLEVENLGNTGFEAYKKRLAAYRTDTTGPILETGEEGLSLRLSPGMIALEESLKGLMNQPFVAHRQGSDFVAILPPRTRLMWNADLLEEALTLTDPFDAFSKGQLQQFPAGLQGRVQGATRDRLEASMMDVIAEAQQLEPATQGFSPRYVEDELRAETRSFRRALKPLGAILSTFDRFGFDQAQRALYSLLVDQASSQLQLVDDLLEAESIYLIDDLSAWDGRGPLTKVLFDARDPSQVVYYLDAQRARLTYLATEYAEPSVMFLTNTRITRGQLTMPLLAKWKGVMQELGGDETKKAGGSLTVLENFIRAELDEITLDSFTRKIRESELDVQTGDFFLDRKTAMIRTIHNRCLELAELEVATGYVAMETLFNGRLAGRYPFSDQPGEVTASLVALREFYRLFQKTGPLAIEVFKRKGEEASPQLVFVEQMAKLETFLGPFLDPDEKKRVAVPMVDYAVEFRKNQAYETGGNQIIGWELRVGDATASRSDTGEGLKGRWRYGDPIRVALRWAKDAKYLPAMAGAYGQVGGDGVTVTYDFGSPWSIVELLRAQASSPDDFETFFDPEPHTLRFVTGTRKARTKVRKGETPKVEQETKVFIRIALYSPEKQVPLTVPTFPERAPALMTTSAIERAIGGLR